MGMLYLLEDREVSERMTVALNPRAVTELLLPSQCPAADTMPGVAGHRKAFSAERTTWSKADPERLWQVRAKVVPEEVVASLRTDLGAQLPVRRHG